MSASWEKSITDYVESRVKEETVRLAKKARDELIKEYKHTIDRFYSEYTPKFYKRHATRGMAPGYSLTYKPFYQNSHGGLGVVYGGVEISNEDMYDDYQSPNSDVLQSFLSGYHGPPSGERYYPPAAGDHMIKFRDILANNLV